MDTTAREPICTPTQPASGPLCPRLGTLLGSALGHTAEPIYRFSINQINRRYDEGRGVVRLDIPVVSVGNLSVGGTGKTPMVQRIVRILQGNGWRPCVAMRGYAKPRPARSNSPKLDASSDEEDVYHRSLPGVPVVAQPNRAAGLRTLVETTRRRMVGTEPNVVVLDDGFQHRRLARDFEVVLIDASRDPFRDRLLPAGWLREPVESLRRADAVVITHAELVSDATIRRIMSAVQGVTQALPPDRCVAPRITVCRHVWTSLKVGDDSRSLDWLRGKRAVATCAIGNPSGFIAALKSSGANVLESLALPDHDRYAPRTIERVARMIRRQSAEVLIVTEKDWSKLRRIPVGWAGVCEVVRPELEMKFDSGWDELAEAMFASIDKYFKKQANSGTLECST